MLHKLIFTCHVVTNYKFPKNLEFLPTEITQGKRKKLLFGPYGPPPYSGNFYCNWKIPFFITVLPLKISH